MFNNRNLRGQYSVNKESSKEKEWGQVKFVPKVPKKVYRPERAFSNAATPWNKFKEELVEKQREEDTSNAVDMNSAEAKEILKKREQNYRRMLIIDKAKQPTTWEAFEDNGAAPKKTTKQKAITETLLKGVDLQNFDSKQLNFRQNNKFRQILTKGIRTTRGSLTSYVKDMKRKSLKKKKKNECQ